MEIHVLVPHVPHVLYLAPVLVPGLAGERRVEGLAGERRVEGLVHVHVHPFLELAQVAQA